ncbi:sugar transferase [Thermoanaerobacterium thermosulfurigenes]|uniref:sugar transferase n=1 Tax=Thermoanaerobacterium thermosulfurigenes TaxID=33950 RepID=UPI003EF4648F
MKIPINKFFRLSKFFVFIVDLSLIHAGFIIAYILRFSLQPPMINLIPYYELIPVITLSTILLFNIYGLYTISRKTYSDILFSLIISLILLQIITTASTFFTRRFAFPRSIFFIAFFIQLISLSIWRYFVQNIRKYVHGEKNIMIIGDDVTAEKLAKKLITSSKGWYDIRYILEPEKFLSNKEYVKEIDAIYICDKIDEEIKSDIISEAVKFKKHIFIVPDFKDILLTKSQFIQFDDVPTISIDYPMLTTEQKIIKRIGDVFLSLFGLIISSPIMLIISLFIKLTSPGPVIYSQTRVTENEREFKVYKFRTMVKDAEKMTGPVLATDNDPRITRIGKILRATRLDELPQLLNVLKGDMSFVGPRPERPYFVRQFEDQYPPYRYRHNVKAGITGLAQVLGKYTTDADDKLRLDLIYIMNYSVWLDIKILLLTLKIALTKEASSGVKNDMTLEELLKSMDYNVYNEFGVTKLEK